MVKNDLNSILGASKDYLKKQKEREELAKRLDSEKNLFEFVGMERKGNVSIARTYSARVLPFVINDTLTSFRVVDQTLDIIFDTGIMSSSNNKTVKEFYRLSSLNDFKNFEQMTEKKILTNSDEQLLKDIFSLANNLRNYYPFFDKYKDTTNKKLDASETFFSKYQSLIKLNINRNSILLPCILLSRNTDATFDRVFDFRILSFNKPNLCRTFMEKIQELGVDEANSTKLMNLFSTPLNLGDKLDFYLTFEIDKSEEDKISNNQTAFDLVTKMGLHDYDDSIFVSVKERMDQTKFDFKISKDLFDKFVSPFNRKDTYDVSSFNRGVYEKAYSILKKGESWVAENKASGIVSVPTSSPLINDESGQGELPF